MTANGQSTVRVAVELGQYYVYATGGAFDESSVDEAHDGVMAPGSTGIRIASGTRNGRIDLTVTVCTRAITLPEHDQVVASACNLYLPTGGITINSFGGPGVYAHDFANDSRCAVLVVVRHRDEARAGNVTNSLSERHEIFLSQQPWVFERWRSDAIDGVGERLAVATGHVGFPG